MKTSPRSRWPTSAAPWVSRATTQLARGPVCGRLGIGHGVRAVVLRHLLAAPADGQRHHVCMAAGVLCPFAPNLSVLMLLRVVQGAAGGALPPMLMTVALRFLPPNIKPVWPGRLCAERHLRSQPGHAAGRLLDRVPGLAMGLLANRPGQHRRPADGVLGLAARPAAPGTLAPVRLGAACCLACPPSACW